MSVNQAECDSINTPVLFLVFNRLDTTKQVFEAIRQARPPRLYIAADGARPSREGEVATVQAVRDYVMSHIDWVCEVKTHFREKNFGCKLAVSSAITWFFEHEEAGIILEDDCLPGPTFFRFCEELLEYYRHDQRIGMISGDNFQFGKRINDDSYYYSTFSHIWGWASWRDRWINDYDVEMKNWPLIRDEGRAIDWYCSKNEQIYWNNVFESVYQGKIDTWDYQWLFACKLNGRLSVIPNVNLISNIGFGTDATHTTGGSVLSNMSKEEAHFPLKHPIGLFSCRCLDKRYSNMFLIISLFRRAKSKWINLLARLSPG